MAWGIGDYLAAGGDLLSIFGGMNQQRASSAALGDLSGQLSALLSQQTGSSEQLINDWLKSVAPELQYVSGSAFGESQGSLDKTNAFAGGAAGAATGMESNPFLSGITGLSGDLANFSGLTPEEIAGLSTQAGSAVSSAAKTFGAESGAVANPNALAQQLATQAGDTTAQTAVQLGDIASRDRLSAREAALGGLTGAGQQYLSGLSGAGSLFSGLGNLYGGLSESQLGAALQGLGIQSNELGTGMSGLTGASGSVADVLRGAYSAQSQGGGGGGGGGGLGSIVSGIAGLAGLFGM